MNPVWDTLRGALVVIALLSAPAAAESGEETVPPPAPSAAPAPVIGADGLEHLNPELAGAPYRIEPGPRPFRHRLALTPALGELGSQPYYALRLAYNPGAHLGYEVTLGHNPGESVHALLHSFGIIVRQPLPWRAQPYLTASYGMVMVSPGESVNADPVTKNALGAGGGLELYIRDDLALRGEIKYLTVFGRQRDVAGVVNYDYFEQTVGLSFYRSIRP